MSGGFNGTGGTVSNPGAGNCSGSGCQENGNDDEDEENSESSSSTEDDDNVVDNQMLGSEDSTDDLGLLIGLNPNSCIGFTCSLPPLTQTGPSSPNWEKIAAGVGILLAVDLLIVAPVVVGIVTVPGALESSMLLTETGWVLPLATAVIAANVYGWDLIIEGANGR